MPKPLTPRERLLRLALVRLYAVVPDPDALDPALPWIADLRGALVEAKAALDATLQRHEPPAPGGTLPTGTKGN